VRPEGGGGAHAIAIVIGCSGETSPAMEEHRLVSVQGGCVKLETSSDGLTDTARRKGARASCARGGPSMQGHCAAIRTLRMAAIATQPYLAVVSCAHTLPNPGGGLFGTGLHSALDSQSCSRRGACWPVRPPPYPRPFPAVGPSRL